MEDASGSGGWRFAQCFGDKGEVEDITEGTPLLEAPSLALIASLSDRSRHYLDRRVRFDGELSRYGRQGWTCRSL